MALFTDALPVRASHIATVEVPGGPPQGLKGPRVVPSRTRLSNETTATENEQLRC